MAEMDIVPYIGTRTPADFDTLFDELEAARGSSASLSDAIAEKADNATTLSGYGITDAYTKTETDTALSGKQNALSQSQLDAVNSGITAEKVTADDAALVELVDSGAKNNIYFDIIGNTAGNCGTTVSFRGVNYTVNNDKTITINRTESATSDSYVYLRFANTDGITIDEFCDGGHIISVGASGGDISTFSLFVPQIGSGGASLTVPDSVVLPDRGSASGINVGININKNYSPSGLVIKPMICTKAAWDISHKFVPYCPSMAEMYEMILALQNGTRSAHALAKAEPEEINESETGEEEQR